ncbi:Proteasome subunit beta type-1 [Glugoides intestinalis]
MVEDTEISTGTTIMALKYRDGVLLAADSRTSSGVFVASRITNKLNQIAENIIICRSGSAADTQKITRIVESEIKKLSLNENKASSVEKTAKLASKIIYENRDSAGILASLIIAGFDTSAKIFKVNICGSIENDLNIAIGGSGSGFIKGYCDLYYRPNMSIEEAIEFAKIAVGLAIRNDIASGGVIRMASITKDKITKYFYSGDKILDQA